MSEPSDELTGLRTRLAEIDEQLVDLVAERQRLSSRIGAIKRNAGWGTRNFAQEKVVIERARRAAAARGLSGDLVQSIVLLLIESSLTVQERDTVAARGQGNGQRVLIIGGAGKMGQWLADFLASQGYGIEIADPAGGLADYPSTSNWRELELDHDLIIVAAPLRISAEILEELAVRKPMGVVFDVGSLKSPLRKPLQNLRAAGVRVTSIHPMFGPSTELLSKRHVIFVDLGDADANRVARQLFAGTMVTQVDMDLESHDRFIAYVLGLSHALNIAFFTALAESGEAAPKLAKLSSTTFDAQLSIATSLAQENPHLYFEIQSLNDYGTEALSALVYAVERVRSIVRSGDEAAFVEMMANGKSYLATRDDA